MQNEYPKDTLRLNIEMADNGIILRDRDDEDSVTLAINGPAHHTDSRWGYDIEHTEEYKAIGKSIYDWIINLVIPEHEDELVVTNIDLDIYAFCMGRERT